MNIQEIATKEDIVALHQKLNSLIATVDRLIHTPDTSKNEKYLTSKEVMEMLRISKSHLNDLRIEGKIPHTKPYGVILYPKAEIEKMLKKWTKGTSD
jgi:hypothetical protein